ncbi:SCO-spondin-like, partial [Pelodiscus sinensis]|uniref:SCO-spondin-like n=1 Tax=Pelodiscus sinensis TaxID=13735 RepID=UPI003F6A9B73
LCLWSEWGPLGPVSGALQWRLPAALAPRAAPGRGGQCQGARAQSEELQPRPPAQERPVSSGARSTRPPAPTTAPAPAPTSGSTSSVCRASASQAAGARRGSCCRTVGVCRSQRVAAGCPPPTARGSCSQARPPSGTATTARVGTAPSLAPAPSAPPTGPGRPGAPAPPAAAGAAPSGTACATRAPPAPPAPLRPWRTSPSATRSPAPPAASWARGRPGAPAAPAVGGGESERSRALLSPGDGEGELCPGPLLLHRACNTHNCTPECPGAQVHSDCANTCPHSCSDLRPGTECLQEPCQPGCACPPGQVLQGGACVPPEECRCSLVPAPAVPWAANLSQEERAREHPPGSTISHQCNSCVCLRGTFNCSQQDCNVDCLWSAWSAWSACSVTCGPGLRVSRRHPLQLRLYDGAECLGPPTRQAPCALPACVCPAGERWAGPAEPCERTCQQIYQEPGHNCSAGPEPGCVCEAGRYRNSSGLCVTAAHCPCEHGGQLHPPGAEWQEGCERCSCLNGRAVCSAGCPPLLCLEGEVKVQEPGRCCPVCRRESFEEPSWVCRRYTEVRNVSKGRCALPGVEVAYCSGRCASRTNVISEEPYLQTLCECCSYHLDPLSPVRILNLPCPDGEPEPVVLPVIHSCECTSCQGGDFSKR